MPIVCWGALGKAANDPTTIDEEIQSYIAAHNADLNAHGLNGYALYIHRSDNPLDHLDYSVTGDKITANQIIGKDFRTAQDVGLSIDGVLMNRYGIQMYNAGIQKVNIPTTGNPTFRGVLTAQELKYLFLYIHTYFETLDPWVSTGTPWDNYVTGTLGQRFFASEAVSNSFVESHLEGSAIDPDKNPFFEIGLRFDGGTNGFGYFGFGELSTTLLAQQGFGFGDIKRTPYAIVNLDGQRYHALIAGVNATQSAIFRAELSKQTGKISFFINGQQYVQINDPGLYEFGDVMFTIAQKNTASARRVFVINNLALGHLAP